MRFNNLVSLFTCFCVCGVNVPGVSVSGLNVTGVNGSIADIKLHHEDLGSSPDLTLQHDDLSEEPLCNSAERTREVAAQQKLLNDALTQMTGGCVKAVIFTYIYLYILVPLCRIVVT